MRFASSANARLVDGAAIAIIGDRMQEALLNRASGGIAFQFEDMFVLPVCDYTFRGDPIKFTFVGKLAEAIHKG